MVNIRDDGSPEGSLANTVRRLLDRGYEDEARAVLRAVGRGVRCCVGSLWGCRLIG